MSPEHSHALEALVGRTLLQDESVVVRPARIDERIAEVEARKAAASALFEHID